MVTIPPLVVRTRASSTVLVKASRRVNRDFAGILVRFPLRECSWRGRVVGVGYVLRGTWSLGLLSIVRVGMSSPAQDQLRGEKKKERTGTASAKATVA